MPFRYALLLALLSVFSVPARADVLASIRPLALIAEAVTGTAMAVQQLVPNGASSHDYQLRPADRLRLAQADVILWVGPAHEQFLQKSLRDSPAVMLAAQTLPGLRLLPQRKLEDGQPLPGSVDPHLWLDPDNAVVIARALAEALARRQPANAARFRRNADGFATRMALLKAQQAQRFQGAAQRAFIAYHDAYQYLEPALGLHYRGSLVKSEESKPSARHFLLLSQKIRAEGIRCLLTEPGIDGALARNVFNGQPARLVAVDELFAAAPSGPQGYEAGLTQMADGIHRCLAGP